MKTFTIQEIKNYLSKQDSYGDIFYNLSEANIIAANEKRPTFIPFEELYDMFVNDELEGDITITTSDDLNYEFSAANFEDLEFRRSEMAEAIQDFDYLIKKGILVPVQIAY